MKTLGKNRELWGYQFRVPMMEVIVTCRNRQWTTVRGGEVFQQFDTGTVCGRQGCDVEPGTEYLIQMFLFRSVNFAVPENG